MLVSVEEHHHNIRLYNSLKDQLLESFPDLDEETLVDTLEGASNLHELIGITIRSAVVDEHVGTGLRELIRTYRARLEKIEARAEKKRSLATQSMCAANLTRISEVDFTATLEQGPEAVEFTDEGKIPNAFWIPVPPKLDKQSLRAALRSGDAIEGAMLSEPKPVLQVRIA